MSQSATHVTQNDMTTCLETFETERFCSFPHRHGEATGKPETRDETRWSIRTNISCETSSKFHTLKLQTRRFPTSFLMNLQICYLKIDIWCEASASIFITSHKTPCVPWNLHLVATRGSPDNAIRTKHATRHLQMCCACHAK